MPLPQGPETKEGNPVLSEIESAAKKVDAGKIDVEFTKKMMNDMVKDIPLSQDSKILLVEELNKIEDVDVTTKMDLLGKIVDLNSMTNIKPDQMKNLDYILSKYPSYGNTLLVNLLDDIQNVKDKTPKALADKKIYIKISKFYFDKDGKNIFSTYGKFPKGLDGFDNIKNEYEEAIARNDANHVDASEYPGMSTLLTKDPMSNKQEDINDHTRVNDPQDEEKSTYKHRNLGAVLGYNSTIKNGFSYTTADVANIRLYG